MCALNGYMFKTNLDNKILPLFPLNMKKLNFILTITEIIQYIFI